jgi:hypothetical protein
VGVQKGLAKPNQHDALYRLNRKCFIDYSPEEVEVHMSPNDANPNALGAVGAAKVAFVS